MFAKDSTFKRNGACEQVPSSSPRTCSQAKWLEKVQMDTDTTRICLVNSSVKDNKIALEGNKMKRMYFQQGWRDDHDYVLEGD